MGETETNRSQAAPTTPQSETSEPSYGGSTGNSASRPRPARNAPTTSRRAATCRAPTSSQGAQAMVRRRRRPAGMPASTTIPTTCAMQLASDPTDGRPGMARPRRSNPACHSRRRQPRRLRSRATRRPPNTLPGAISSEHGRCRPRFLHPVHDLFHGRVPCDAAVTRCSCGGYGRSAAFAIRSALAVPSTAQGSTVMDLDPPRGSLHPRGPKSVSTATGPGASAWAGITVDILRSCYPRGRTTSESIQWLRQATASTTGREDRDARSPRSRSSLGLVFRQGHDHVHPPPSRPAISEPGSSRTVARAEDLHRVVRPLGLPRHEHVERSEQQVAAVLDGVDRVLEASRDRREPLRRPGSAISDTSASARAAKTSR